MTAYTNIRDSALDSRKPFVYRHLVTFEDTNVVGNVYFARHISWQGRCRESFLKAYAAGIVADLKGNFRLVTLQVSCEYYEELHALDEIEVRMRLAYLRQHKIGLDFDYMVINGGENILMAKGFQEIGCMEVTSRGLQAVTPPEDLARALQQFTHT
ncbi:acyl-CoA thioesterase [Mesorhizobium silamurunense]|uniref:acyl-CoA thioesterase n=1 Tax=Mesorhizobium silamurunense TaxID=499528 RepID=UPI00177EAD99|nr:acyl-CoA thioesterase [Mesorhizobium silamurunense]